MKNAAAGATAARAEMLGVSLNHATLEGALFDVHLRIENPHTSVIDLVDIDFLFQGGDEAAAATDEEDEEDVVVRKVRHPYAIQPGASELVKVPVDLVFRDVLERRGSSRVEAGQLIPCTVRANLRCRHSILGVFRITADKLRHMFTACEPKEQQQQQQQAFDPPTGYVNGMHIVGVSPHKVDFELVLRVKNSNPLPVELTYADFNLSQQQLEVPAAAAAKVLTKRARVGVSVGGMSAERLVIPVSFSFKEMESTGFELVRGQMLAFRLGMEFVFQQSVHGTYRIAQEKTGTLPLLHAPRLKLVAMAFERDAQGKPVARVSALLDNSLNPIAFTLSKLALLIQKAADTVVTASLPPADGQEQQQQQLEVSDREVAVDLLARDDLAHPDFGSALWEVFSGSEAYKRSFTLEGKSSEFGTIRVP